MQKELTEALQVLCDNLTNEQTIWSNIQGLTDFDGLLVNIDHDAQTVFSEQLSLDPLRHTYITCLASQGARLMILYPKSLELHGGGKRMRPHELSPLSDWGECVQPTNRQFQG